MVMSNFGKLCDYAHKEDWQSYVECLELFLQQTMLPMHKKKTILLIFCGIETYQLFKGLTAPAKTVEKTSDELVTLKWQIMKIQKGI